jgi:integrase/recombinase XerD
MGELVVIRNTAGQGIGVPALIAGAKKRARTRFLEFFTVNIRNKNTRTAYARAAGAFLRWCEGQEIGELGRVQPVHVAAYIEHLGREMSPPTVKQHLACIRMLFDWLVTGQVMPSNPVHSVRGPRHSVSKGSTPVLSSEEATAPLKGMDVSTVVGMRDRALIGVMTYTFARVSAVVALAVEDYFPVWSKNSCGITVVLQYPAEALPTAYSASGLLLANFL